MRRHKVHICVLHWAHGNELLEAIGNAHTSLLYGDTVAIATDTPGYEFCDANRDLVEGIDVMGVLKEFEDAQFRTNGWRYLRHLGEEDARDKGPMEAYVVALEATQTITDPESIRDIIEFNYPKTIAATRYFMWDDHHYRSDGIYRPLRLPLAGPYSPWLKYDNPLNTFPGMFYRNNSIESPIEVLDLRYVKENRRFDDGTPTLRPYEKAIWQTTV